MMRAAHLGLLMLALAIAWQQGKPVAKRASDLPNRHEIAVPSSGWTPVSRPASGRDGDSAGSPGGSELVGATGIPDSNPLGGGIERAIKDVMAIADPNLQSEAIETLVTSIAPADMPNWAKGLADSNLSGVGAELLERAIRQWAEVDYSAASAWAEQQSASATRQAVLNQVALAWAEKDLPKAVEWAVNLPADDAQIIVLRNLGYELASTDPIEALTLAAVLPPGRDGDDLTVHAVSQWADTDATAATEWACAIPELALRERVLASIAAAMADQSPNSAVVLTAQALWPGKSQNQAAIAIVQRWTQQDPLGAATWVQHFPVGELREIAVRNLIAVWSQGGSEAPASWLNSLSEGAIREIGADALACATHN